MSEIKDIPEHWEVKKLSDVVDKLSLNKIKIKQRDYLQQGKFPVVDQGQALVGGYFNDDNFVVPSEPPYIIFGDHTKVKKFINFKFIAGADGVKVLKPKSNIDPRFLYYAIHTIKIDDKGYARHFQLLEKSDIPLPPLPEQQAIVAKIEELLSELDNGKQQLQTALQQLKVYRQSLLKWHYDKSVGSVPVKLVDVCEFITKGTTPSKDKLLNYKGDVPFLKVYNLTFNGTIDFSKDPTFVDNETHNVFLKRSRVYPNDVLMNIVGPPLGKVSIVPDTFPEWNINQAIVRFRCKTEILPKYLLHFLLCEYTIRTYSRKAKATAGQFNLTLEICRDIEIPLPPISEQQLIVDELESKLTLCDNVEETIKLSLQQAETLRQSILKKAFEGKLV